MKRYAAERILLAAIGVFLATLVVFVSFRVVTRQSDLPADSPVRESSAGRRVAAYYEGPVHERYARFLSQLVGRGSLGESFYDGRPVNRRVWNASVVTASLVLGAASLWLLVAVPLGLVWARQSGLLVSLPLGGFVHLAIALLPIWVGLYLSFYIGYEWGLSPITGYCDFFDPSDEPGSCGGARDWAAHLALPWITLALPFAAVYTRVIRTTALRVSVGLRESGLDEAARARLRRLAVLSLVQRIGFDLGFAIGAAVFVEAIFGLPGLGLLLMQAINLQDFPLAEGVLIFAALIALLAHLAVDLACAALEPV